MKEVQVNKPSDLAPSLHRDPALAVEPDGRIQHFSYQRPDLPAGRPRGIVRLVNTDILLGLVQIFEDGGETKMHSHTGMDGFWMVLSGRAKFYFANREPIEIGPHQGVCTPRNVQYWFEKIGAQTLEILQVDAVHAGLPNRIKFAQEAAEETADRVKQNACFDAAVDAD